MAENPHPFESAWLKWSWATAHAHTLKTDVEIWRNHPDRQRDVVLMKRHDTKRHRIDVIVAKVEPFPIEWGLVLGEIAHNYRSCLDHVAWTLVERGRTPLATLTDRQQGNVYFPIHADRLEFNAALPRKVPGLRRTDIAIVRSYQPYKHGKLKSPYHAIAILARISRHDKHRTIQPVLAIPAAVNSRWRRLACSRGCATGSATANAAEPCTRTTSVGRVRFATSTSKHRPWVHSR